MLPRCLEPTIHGELPLHQYLTSTSAALWKPHVRIGADAHATAADASHTETKQGSWGPFRCRLPESVGFDPNVPSTLASGRPTEASRSNTRSLSG
jgi:hypothetical protein